MLVAQPYSWFLMTSSETCGQGDLSCLLNSEQGTPLLWPTQVSLPMFPPSVQGFPVSALLFFSRWGLYDNWTMKLKVSSSTNHVSTSPFACFWFYSSRVEFTMTSLFHQHPMTIIVIAATNISDHHKWKNWNLVDIALAPYPIDELLPMLGSLTTVP